MQFYVRNICSGCTYSFVWQRSDRRRRGSRIREIGVDDDAGLAGGRRDRPEIHRSAGWHLDLVSVGRRSALGVGKRARYRSLRAKHLFAPLRVRFHPCLLVCG
jgi:hypothetical protein